MDPKGTVRESFHVGLRGAIYKPRVDASRPSTSIRHIPYQPVPLRTFLEPLRHERLHQQQGPKCPQVWALFVGVLVVRDPLFGVYITPLIFEDSERGHTVVGLPVQRCCIWDCALNNPRGSRYLAVKKAKACKLYLSWFFRPNSRRMTLGIPVCTCYLLWGPKTYFGLFGAPGTLPGPSQNSSRGKLWVERFPASALSPGACFKTPLSPYPKAPSKDSGIST